MPSLSLTLLILGAGILALPLLDPRDERTRTALFAICIVLVWRYVIWRFADTLPPFTLRVESLRLGIFSDRSIGVSRLDIELCYFMPDQQAHQGSERASRLALEPANSPAR